MLPKDTKKHKLYTVAKVPHKEHVENDTAVIQTNETNKSKVCLKSLECNSIMNEYKAKDHNKRKDVISINITSSSEDEEEYSLLFKTPMKKMKKEIPTKFKTSLSPNKVIKSKQIAWKECLENDVAEICTKETKKSNEYLKSSKYDFTTKKHKATDPKERKDKGTWTAHDRFHTGGRPYTCDVCDRTFTGKSHLSNHYRLHTGEKPYGCDDCGRTFTEKSTLATHCRLHTGERPYTCDICGKTCIHKSNLTVHYRLHTSETPYTCDTCGKSFIQKSDLTKHNRSHTGERPYTCDTCDKSFIQKSDLTKHNRSHTGERPYECVLCEKSFSRSDHLTRHVRTKHERCL